jgi:hypothetical protein
MDWKPFNRENLDALTTSDLAECSDELRALFERAAFPPAKWRLSPWGDQGGGFWAVAAYQGRVLWYNDIEEGFNVSRFEQWGEIPPNEYWCDQDSLRDALPKLSGA